jgi:ribose 5-phosphate isomerase B
VRIACAFDHAGMPLRTLTHQAVERDDVDVLCLGARVVGPSYAEEIIRAYLRATFSGEDRHVRRLGKILAIEAEFSREETA